MLSGNRLELMLNVKRVKEKYLKKSPRRMVVSEEEMDNIANEALEAVLGCT